MNPNHPGEDITTPPLPELPKVSASFNSEGKRPTNAKEWEFYNELHNFYNENFTAIPRSFVSDGHFRKSFESNIFNINNEQESFEASVVVNEVTYLNLSIQSLVTNWDLFGVQATEVQKEVEIPTETLEEQQEVQVTKACDNLITVVGEIEFQLGVNSLLGHNYSTAVSHFKLGASHDHPGALFNLGLCYEQGLGVNKDMKMVSFFLIFSILNELVLLLLLVGESSTSCVICGFPK